MTSQHSTSQRIFSSLLGFLFVSAVYLFTFPEPNVFYAVIVFLHVVTGMFISVWLAIRFFHVLRTASWPTKIGWFLLTGGAALGLILIKTGTLRTEWNWLYAHIVLSTAGFGFLIASARSKSAVWARAALVLVVLGALGLGSWYLRTSRWENRARIENPANPPASMNEEGDGPQGPFFPSSAQVYGGEKIPSKFFIE